MTTIIIFQGLKGTLLSQCALSLQKPAIRRQKKEVNYVEISSPRVFINGSLVSVISATEKVVSLVDIPLYTLDK